MANDNHSQSRLRSFGPCDGGQAYGWAGSTLVLSTPMSRFDDEGGMVCTPDDSLRTWLSASPQMHIGAFDGQPICGVVRLWIRR